MEDIIKELLDVIKYRQKYPLEKSYTCYLLDEGTDKILKKIGEECSETIIAVKNKDKNEIVNENINIEDIKKELQIRAAKQQNLKEFHKTDKNT